jgi:hypothetical protein
MRIQRTLFAGLLAAAFAVAATPAHADRDAVQFGSNIHVTADQPVHDAVCFFCSVHVEGKVTGDIVVFFGSIHLAGDAHHDVVNFFGDVTAEDNSSIDDDLVSFFGAVRLGENVSVGKDLVVMFGTLHAPASVSVGGDRVVWPGWILWGPVLIILLVVIVVVHELRAYRRRQLLRGYQFPPRP